MKTTPNDLVHARDYYVVNELMDSYNDVKNLHENGRWDTDEEFRKLRKAFKRVLKFYGKEIE